MDLRRKRIHVSEGFLEFGDGGADADIEVSGFTETLHVGTTNERITLQTLLHTIEVCEACAYSPKKNS